MPVSEEDFRGTARFSVVRRLGAGAFGVVYEVFDRERDQVVALKTLRTGSVESLYRLKREFRTLADITHPNLATLYELVADGDSWFITMELVRGVHFLRHVCPAPVPSPAAVLDPTESQSVSEASSLAEIAIPPSLAPAFDEARLREALRQAVLGVSALHAAGKLHRDIKPSNVLVTADGRVVMLDFGLVTDFDPFGEDRSLSLVGTPAYMAPELGSRTPPSESSDWYSLGVMLYEALTGRQPFAGKLADMMWDKNRSEPPAPRGLVSGIPEDLDALCLDLLRSDPRARPTGGEILRRLGASPPTADRPAEAVSLSLRAGPFVGREKELRALRDAFEASRRGRTVRAYVHGTSGIGKSALVRRFLEGLRREDVVVLSGRCYERESTPYKALDSLIDSLSQHLKRLPASEAEALLPADILALTRVFPVLRRVEAVAATRRRPIEIADAFELRRRAFAALRELFIRLAARRDVVLFIDDLQWGDADSAALLDELLRPPDPPALLLILCYRSEEVETSATLKRLLAQADASDVRHVAVEELAPAEARELVTALLESNPSELSRQADAIAREAAGHPFFIDQLVRFGRLGAETTLDAMVRARVRQLPEPARQLLEVVAVAGQPLDAETAERAALVGDRTGAAPLLRISRLVRARTAGDRQEIEPYHDRIREAVVAHIPADSLKDHHRRLAVALEASGRADPEELLVHFQGAGDLPRAADLAALAGDGAAQTLAFDRAARLYRTAIEFGSRGGTEKQRSLYVKLGDALGNAGHSAEAAKAYLAAADGADRAEGLELERRAAGHLLQSGHNAEALPLFERLTGQVGLKLIQPTWRTLFQFALGAAWIRIRGTHFRERDASRIPAEELLRLDTLWTLCSGLALFNAVRGRELQIRHLLSALRTGEPRRVAIAIGWECGYQSIFSGWRARSRGERLFRTATALADRLDDPYPRGLAHMSMSGGDLFIGQWRASWDHGQKAEEILREKCRGSTWEVDVARLMSLRALFYLGGLKELSLQLPGLLREANQRDDLIAVTNLGVRHAFLVHLAADDAQTARSNLSKLAPSRGGDEGFHNKHYWAMYARAEIELYDRQPARADDDVRARWPAFERSHLPRFQFFRLESWHLRARIAVARASEDGVGKAKQDELLRSAARDAHRLERAIDPWIQPLAVLIRAGIAANRGTASEAGRLLELAERELLGLDMALYAAAARRRRGQLLGGDEGAALVAEADGWMAGQDIKNPSRMSDMLAPGRWN